jgi:hypothetical protein
MRAENKSQQGQPSKDKANFQGGSGFFKTRREGGFGEEEDSNTLNFKL